MKESLIFVTDDLGQRPYLFVTDNLIVEHAPSGATCFCKQLVIKLIYLTFGEDETDLINKPFDLDQEKNFSILHNS